MSLARSILLASLVIAGLTLTTSLAVDPVSELPGIRTAPAPQFVVQRNSVTTRISGHTLSAQHEQQLLDIASELFPEQTLVTDFEPLGVVPAHWQQSTLQSVLALQDSAAARITLSDDELRIRALPLDPETWRARMLTIRASLDGDIAVDDASLPLAAISATDLCDRAIDAYRHEPIRFLEATTTLRPSAIPVLQRAAALANSCPDRQLTITGHTDASGDPASNEALSLSRSAAVADVLSAQGVAKDRLKIRGVGGIEPIASNASRYGRSLNRRIELSFD